MVKSMTGYGREVRTLHGRQISAEVRSVNNRYLDCTVRLPRMASFAEDSVKRAVKAVISRGKVEVYLSIQSEGGEELTVTLNRGVLEGYLAGMRQMVEQYGVREDISAGTLARMSDVFTVSRPEVDEDSLQEDLLEAVNAALAAFDAMRSKEGAALEADLRSRGKTILNLVAQIEQGSGQTVSDYRARLEAKLREVLGDRNIDESRILTEAAIFADKIAVDEETVRLRSHLDQMNTMLTEGGPVGRKLDFLLQEMNREANTIGSKCTDLRLAKLVVEIKAELEKIREQVQNLE